ncbi:MAG: hypothetical protein K2U26_04750 [Cyclobacteriaceae bacterium]|nr:hypothetical protein [Cyclobacteriaceae bacterium]
MRIRYFYIVLILAYGNLFGQSYTDFTNSFTSLYRASSLDSSAKAAFVNQWFAQHHVPLIAEDSVLFLYRGDAKSVAWMGDFNGWGYQKDFQNKGKKIPNTPIWYLKCSFPKNARMDYKIVVNGVNWVLDPENHQVQWSGVGGGSPNSELRMPEWREDAIVHERPGVAKGTLKRDLLLTSKVLGYQITYSVYLPHGYEALGKLPVVYVTDGYEYMLPELGNMVTILDNLLADKKIKPIVAVFIDHREPINRANNRRMEELSMNDKYLRFFAEEFLPAIEAKYPVDSKPSGRAILGTSMGGLTAAYFAFTRPDLFSMAGIQSPAFYTRPQIYSVCDNPNGQKIKVSMTSGLVNDASEGSRKMKEILQNNACDYHYRENNEGHSWGNWRNLIDDILIDFFGNP